MGMYTEFVFGAELKHDTPKEVIGVLKYIILSNVIEKSPDMIIPKHPFFETDRWHLLGQCSSYSFGFSASCSKMVYDNITTSWLIAIRSSIKNYNNEIEKFMDWIKPYIKHGSGRREFLGYSLYEEAEEPKLYYLLPKREES